MKKVIYRTSKEMLWNLYLEGLDTKAKLLDYLNSTSGIKKKIVDIEVF